VVDLPVVVHDDIAEPDDIAQRYLRMGMLEGPAQLPGGLADSDQVALDRVPRSLVGEVVVASRALDL